MTNRFHCCATCVHFLSQRHNGKMKYECKRLGYDTSPKYTFNCWEPKEQVKRLMEKEKTL
ncbi:hypothetical protein [Bacillus fonticola]|uniref:hypothetical protein n=1 Tax=Bacillus fonticola TaxID=2728853 RepID=UPI001D14D40A|nr:hypothetical protein [Bacillus fonticola]